MTFATGVLALSGAYVGSTAAGMRGLDIMGASAKIGAVIGVLFSLVWFALDARLGTLGNAALFVFWAGVLYLSWRVRKGREEVSAVPSTEQ